MNIKKPANNKIDAGNNNNKTDQENQENEEVENIIYEEGICGGIGETEQIYSTDIDNNDNDNTSMELLNYY